MEAAQCHDGVMPAVSPRGEARPRVLVVDDHAAVLHSYRQILGGGEEAVQVAAELGQLESALFGAPCTQVVHERPFEVDTFCDGQQACVAAACRPSSGCGRSMPGCKW